MPDLPEIKLDLTEAVNATAITALAKPAEATGDLATTAISFLHNLLLYPMQKYNIYATHKLEKFKQSLEDRVKQIPDDKIAEPTISIWGNVCDSLKWNLDEEHIKSAFVELLMADINSDTKSTVNPAYIEVVKQLGTDGAEFLKSHLKTGHGIEVYDISDSIKIAPTQQEGFHLPHGLNSRQHKFYVLVKSNDETVKLSDVTIDILVRQNLITVQSGYYQFITDEEVQRRFERILINYNLEKTVNEMFGISYERKIIVPTAFGKGFINIVCK